MQRRSIPKNPFERFRLWLWEMDELYDLHSEVEVGRAVDILSDALTRSIERTSVNMKRKSPIHVYIAVFKGKYVELIDREYARDILGADIRAIKRMCDALRVESASPEDYLCWFFDDFLVDNPRFCPPTIKSSCSEAWFEKFLFVNKSKIRMQKQQEAQNLEVRRLTQEARELYRISNDETPLDLLAQWNNGGMTLKELGEHMDEFKRELEERKGNSNGQ